MDTPKPQATAFLQENLVRDPKLSEDEYLRTFCRQVPHWHILHRSQGVSSAQMRLSGKVLQPASAYDLVDEADDDDSRCVFDHEVVGTVQARSHFAVSPGAHPSAGGDVAQRRAVP